MFTHTPQSLQQVLALLRQQVHPLAAEMIPVLSAYRRVPVVIPRSPVNLPDFERSAMDGFAIRAADSSAASMDHPVRLQVVGECLAGQLSVGQLHPGQAIRITTGAAIPAGADAVVPIEDVQVLSETEIELRSVTVPGKHVIRVGEDLKIDDPVLPAASLTRRLRAQDVAMLVAVGISEIEVARRPRVQTLVTGDELLRPGACPEGVHIVDSNSPMLSALCQRDGAEWLGVEYVPDDYDSICKAMSATDADVLLVTGGTSVGASDYAARAVAQLGALSVHGVRLRPGAPVGMGMLNDQRLVFLLPGNPVACLCTYDLLAGPAIRRMGRREESLPYRQVQATLAKTLRSEPGRVDYIRLRLRQGQADPVPGGASRLSTVVHADGFTLIPEEQAELSAGESIPVWLY